MKFPTRDEAHAYLRTLKPEPITIDKTAVIFYEYVTLGRNVAIGSHSVIGKIGFGFEWNADKYVRINHVGKVVIEDDVEIGALCAIDRAKLDETRICRGVKTDNNVHIAHNCYIGPNCQLAAGVILGGSVHIGANTFLGLNVTIKDHVTIGEHVIIGSGANIFEDVPDWAIVISKSKQTIIGSKTGENV